MERVDFVQADLVGSDEHAGVVAVADSLFDHLATPAIAALIQEANQPGHSSAHIQSVFLDHAHHLGFRDESKGLFLEYSSSALRPDYFMPLGESGIILEVERGKTTINNMACSTSGSATMAMLNGRLGVRQDGLVIDAIERLALTVWPSGSTIADSDPPVLRLDDGTAINIDT